MKKGRLIFFILSILIISLSISLSIYYPEIPNFYYLNSLLMIVFIFSTFYKKKKEMQEIRSIIFNYFNSCDTNEYIKKITEFSKSCVFFTKAQKMSFKLYLVQGYIDSGDFKNAEKCLLEIDKYSNKFSQVTKFIYLKTWCDYFFFTHKDEKMKYTIEKIKVLISSINNMNIRMSCNLSYQIIISEYMLISNSSNLKYVKDILYQRLRYENQNKSRVIIKYLIGILCLKEKLYEQGITMLTDVSKNNRSLFVCENSLKLINQYNELLQNEN